jgi:hypothetical protein
MKGKEALCFRLPPRSQTSQNEVCAGLPWPPRRESEAAIMVRQPTDRIDVWWNLATEKDRNHQDRLRVSA